MRRSIQRFNIGNPWACELLKIGLLKYPAQGIKLCLNALPKSWIWLSIFLEKINNSEFKLIDHALLKAGQKSSHTIKSTNPP